MENNSKKTSKEENEKETITHSTDEISKENYEELQIEYKELLSEYDELKLENADPSLINKKLEDIEKKHNEIITVFSKLNQDQ